MSPVSRFPAELSDEELLAEVALGQLESLGVLFDRYEGHVKRFIARLGVPSREVDDLVQATFLDVPRASLKFDGRSSVRSWIMGLAAMIVRRHRRFLARAAARLTTWASLPPPKSPTPPDQEFELHEATARAFGALAALSVKKREVFVMVALEHASGDEVARALGIPVATVWTRLHHARRELRALLAEDDS